MNRAGALPVGSLVRDRASDRLGVYMGMGGPYAMLRPVGGGQEWEARPGDLQPEVSAITRGVDVAQLHAAFGDHLGECETCAADEPCEIGRVLVLACEEAARQAEPAAVRPAASGVLAIRPGEPVPPGPFPCSICRAKGRQ